jgi:hypothetical protein
MPRPHRGSKPVSGGPRAAKNRSRCPPTPATPTTTGDPHVSRVSARPLALQLGQKPLPVRGGLLAILPAEGVLVSTTAHQGSQYLLQAAGKEDMTE